MVNWHSYGTVSDVVGWSSTASEGRSSVGVGGGEVEVAGLVGWDDDDPEDPEEPDDPEDPEDPRDPEDPDDAGELEPVAAAAPPGPGDCPRPGLTAPRAALAGFFPRAGLEAPGAAVSGLSPGTGLAAAAALPRLAVP
jgi:hypothetical protein